MTARWLVSACLVGRACRYDGATRARPEVAAFLDAHAAAGAVITPVCPEELGGLGTPRPPAELRGGDGAAVWLGRATVRRLADSTDLTGAFQAGARAALAHEPRATHALLKARSPSCGCGRTWRDGAVGPGDGVFAALLRSRGVVLQTEAELGAPEVGGERSAL